MWAIDAADPVVGGIRFRKTPPAASLEIRRHERESWFIRNVLERCSAKKMPVVCGCDRIRRSPSRQQSGKNGSHIDANSGKTDQRANHLLDQVDGPALRIEAELRPCKR